jgi:hypothetical protein
MKEETTVPEKLLSPKGAIVFPRTRDILLLAQHLAIIACVSNGFDKS